MQIPQYIARPLYLNRILPFVGKDVMKVLVGQRRVGKSFMLFQLMDHIAQMDSAGQQIYINKELHEFTEIRTSDDLIAYVDLHRLPDRKLYLFIDEVQDIEDFESALRNFQASGGIDIYCTGSNAKMLSGELATYLSGRYVEIKIYSLTYPEFLEFHGLERSQESFNLYLQFGGLPYLSNLVLEEQVVFDYLRNIFDAILLKDIVARYDIRNVNFLQRLARFLADNTGNLVSARKISNFLKAQQVTVSHNLVLDYLSYLTSALLVFRADRYDIVGKKIFEVGEKYYFEDHGLRHALVGFGIGDINKILENVVYLNLRAAGYEVKVGQLSGHKEIDFVCERGSERIYIQVAYLIPTEEVHQREFGNLLVIPDNFPKFVLSMDEINGDSYEGIQHVHVEEFLFFTLWQL